jgi:hypothetical protein
MIVVPQITRAGVVLILLLLNGCPQPPGQQLEAAQKAVDDAKTAGAETYAKDDWMKLEQEFALAKDELAKQEMVFPIFRLYDDVGEMLSTVVEYGGHVAAKASQNKETAKTAALVMEQGAQQVIASANELMAKAPTGKERADRRSRNPRGRIPPLLGNTRWTIMVLDEPYQTARRTKPIRCPRVESYLWFSCPILPLRHGLSALPSKVDHEERMLLSLRPSSR